MLWTPYRLNGVGPAGVFVRRYAADGTALGVSSRVSAPGSARPEDGDPPFGRKRPVAERHPEIVVGVERASEPEEVVLDRAALLLSPRDLEERLGVRLDAILLRHAPYRLPFPFPTWPM